MLRLTDSELDAVLQAAAPIDHDRRGAFLEAVALELGRHEIIGDGTVFRVAREQQGRFFSPPLATETNGRKVGKYA